MVASQIVNNLKPSSSFMWRIGSLSLLILCLGARASTGREWKSSNGKFTIEAEFVAVKGEKVVLEKPDGSYLSVPLDKLCDEDLEFIQGESGQPVSRKEADEEEPPSNQKTAGNRSGGPPLVNLKGEKPTDPPGEARMFPDLGGRVRSLAFFPSGGLLAAGKTNRALVVLDLVEVARTGSLEELRVPEQVEAMAFTPDGKKLLAAGSRGLIQIWDVSKSGELKKSGQFSQHSESVFCISVSADSKFALSGEAKRVRFWEIDSGKEIAVYDGLEDKVKACQLAKDGRTAYVTDAAALLTIDLKRAKVDQRKLAMPRPAGGFAVISSDCRLLAVEDSNQVRMWEIESGKELPVLKDSESLWCGAFTPDGTKLFTGGRGKVNVWDVKRGKRVSVLQTGGTGHVERLAASPDNWHIAASPSNPGENLQVFRIAKD